MPSYNKEKAFKKRIRKAAECRLPKKISESVEKVILNDENVCSESSCDRAEENVIIPKSSFKSLKGILSDVTYQNIINMGYETMTDVQARVIPRLIGEYPSSIITSKTGSGKTLTFITVVIEFLSSLRFRPCSGTGAIILSPTREVAMQTYGVLDLMIKDHKQTIGLLMGGEDKKQEANKLMNGVNIIVATPGRLLHHLKDTEHFCHDKVAFLVIDEADRMLDFGFADQISEINNLLTLSPSMKRAHLLFSATKTERMCTFSRSLMGSSFVNFHIGEDIVPKLEHAYIEVETDKKLAMLATIILKSPNKKIMVFFNSVDCAHYYEKLLNTSAFNPDYLEKPILGIHSKKKKNVRSQTFIKFCRAETGVLMCTDIASRGWDIPAVHLIIQFDAPSSPNEYIQRVGRTARAGRTGYSLLFLTKDEMGLIPALKERKYIVRPSDMNISVMDIQDTVEKIVKEETYFKIHAKEAIKGFLRSYRSHECKDIFNFDKLDLQKLAKCVGLQKVPYIDPALKPSKRSLEIYEQKQEERRSKHIRFNNVDEE